jgi:hypothetical protein
MAIPMLATSDEDEISPETLPDELPKVTTIEVPPQDATTATTVQTPPPNETKAQKITEQVPLITEQGPLIEVSASAKQKEEDAELEKPIPPLMVVDPLVVEMTKQEINRNRLDEELSLPDPNYTPPAPPPVLKAKPENTKPENKTVKTDSPKPENKTTKSDSPEPKLKKAPLKLVTVKLEPVVPTRISTLKTKRTLPPNIPLVLAPNIISQITPEGTRGIPIETFISKLAVPPTTPSRAAKGVSDFSIILANNEFFPAKIVLKSGDTIRLLFTTTNRKSAALVVERLNIQRWVASSDDEQKKDELDRQKFEVNRELNSTRVTEIEFEPKPGIYGFHDAITGASGEILVEEP